MLSDIEVRIVFASGIICLICAAGLAICNHIKTKRILSRIQRMLDAAIEGTFQESAFDESLYSAIENKLGKYLSASEISARKTAEEKDRIKTMIADISHQTKTPLANILLYTELLKEQEQPAENQESLELLENQAQKLKFLIDSLVKLSRLETGILVLQRKKTDIFRLLEDAEKQFANQAKAKGLYLHIFSEEARGINACFDPKWTLEALGNLIDNAIKYTDQQIKRIILLQAVMLSLIGIPAGMVIGYLLGVVLKGTVVAGIVDAVDNVNSLNPSIFIGAAVFSLVTVYLSSRRPSRMAAKVSPIEALRYTEGYQGRKKARKAKTGASIPKMAWANLGRSKSKTVLSVVSMSLAIVVLDLTYVFTGGFDMDKYLRRMTQDFILADASYFQVASHTWGYGSNAEDAVLEEEVIAGIEGQDGITGGRTYGTISNMQELEPEEWARKKYGNSMIGVLSGADLDFYVNQMLEQVGDKRADDRTRLYGMEDFVLDKLTVLDGDISKLKGEGNYIAAVYDTDDYNNVYTDWHWAKVGDKVTLRYVDRYEYCDPNTGEVFPDDTDFSKVQWTRRAIEYREEEYEVAATVVIPSSLTYRNYGDDDFVMGAETFKKHTGTEAVMYYAFDCEDDKTEAMEQYLKEYTQGAGSAYDYESKASYAEEFYEMRDTFLFVGTAVSFVIGLIGVLNFFNAILTGILTRKKEFAVLQSVGMTGKQLNRMLMIEGIIFAGSAVMVTLVLIIAMGPMIGTVLESMFWFFNYRINIVPILAVAPFFLLLGVAIPLVSYKYVAKRSVVERLREAE